MSNRPPAPGGKHSGVRSRAKGAHKGALALGLFVAAAIAGAQTDLGSGQVRIIGTGLDITPSAQTVPVGIPTRVTTVLQVPAGVRLPPSVSVRAELNGPGIAGTLALSTEPNGFFVIPAQTVRGTYVLSGVRLVDGEAFISYSNTRDATITVTDILIAQVTSRPLTYQEMLDKGIVVSPKNFKAYNFVFSIQIESRLQEFEVPVVFPELGPPVLPSIPRPTGTTPLPEFFSPPQVRSVRWSCADLAADVALGLQYATSLGGPIELPCGFTLQGGSKPPGDPRPDTRPVLFSLLLIPGDVAYLNQFFSLSVLVQNGAPSGSNLRLEGVTAKLSIPPGLRAAETNSPTNLSDPVPIVDPGPDGKLGTADDITFLLAQSVGKAELLVEGLRSGRWDVPIDLQATLTGLPAGPVPLKGQTVGSVLVRNPSFFVTMDHPDVIRAGETYTIAATVVNTSAVAANLVSVKLDKAFITGADLLSDETVALGNIAAGDSALARFQLKALRTGRATSEAFFADGSLAGGIVLHAGVGELSIPLSPDTLAFPLSVDRMSQALVDPARRLLGLAWSIAKSPDGTPPAGLPRVGEQGTRFRVDDLILAARHKDLGESESTAASDFLLGWLNGGAEKSTGFDQLRRASSKGAEIASAWGVELTRYWQQESPFDFQKRIAAELPERSFVSAVLSAGLEPLNPSARLVLAGTGVPGRSQLFSGETGYERSLANAELFRASRSGTQYEAGWIGGPDAGGYQVQIAGKRSDNVTLTLTYPGAGSKLVFATIGPFPVVPGSVAFVDVIPGVDPAQLTLQGTNFAPIEGNVELQPRPPLRLLAAVQDLEADPRGHAISLLFNRALSPDAAPEDKAKYEVRSSFGVNATSAVFHQLGHSIDASDPRRVIVGVASHPSPYVTSTVRVIGLADTGGVAQSPDPQVADLNVRDTTAGGTVEGVVVGAAGEPVAGASVVLRMHETSDTTGQTFLDDFAATTADGAGHFFFEYVQIRQGEVFQVFAADPATGYDGNAFGQLRTAGQSLVVNVVLLGRGDVTGRVLDETGVPVANAFVTAESVFFKSDENRGSTNSAADGSFSFKSLPVGAVQLWAIDPASRKTAFQVASIPAAGATVTQNIVIGRTLRASLSGDVIHERDGKPAAGLYVVVYGEVVSVPYEPGTDRKYFGYRVTDDSGRFSFTDIQPGADLVQVFDFARSRTPILGQTLQIPADSETVLHLVELEPQADVGAVEGYARLSANGVITALANSLVTVSDAAVGAVTDTAGHYRLDGVPVGSHVLSAYNPVTQKFKSGQAVVQKGVVFTLDFVFETATSSTTVRGQVLDPNDRAVPNAGVAEFGGSGNILRSVIADGTGRFAFTDVTRGGHTYYALGQDDASGSMRDDVGAAFLDYAGTSEGSITIHLAGWGTVQGKVIASHLDEYGNPAESPLGARLVLKSQKLVKIGQFGLIVASGESSNQLSAPADAADSSAADGSYTFANVLGGSFQLTVHHPVFGDQSVSGTITRPGQIATNDFRYSNALSWIDGYLYDEKGNPIGGADVDLWTSGAPPTRDDPRNPPYATVKTLAAATDDGGAGYFRIPSLPDRSFTLAFQGVVNGVRRFDQAFVSVGGAPHAIRVTLRTRVVQDVRVRVLIPDANNDLQPVSAASVRLHESDWPNRTFRFDSGPDGVAFFPGISEGRFTVNAQSLAAAGSAGGCVCLDGGIVEATVVLPGSGSVGGVVRFPGTNAPVASAQVLVLAGGEPVAAIQTSADGSYVVEGLALNRTFTVRVKDSASARFGFAPDFALGANGDQKTRDVTLLALGNVAGTFTDAKGTRPIVGATIELVSDSLLGRTRFYSGTDSAGTFTFSGIPQGTYSLSAQDPLTRLSGRNEGSIDMEGAIVVTNLRAQASGTVTGKVLSASGAPLAIPPIVTLSAAGIPSRTVIASDFSFSDLPLVAFTITAEEQASPPRRRSAASGSLTADGEVQTLELRYVAYGGVTVHVTRINADGSETDAQRGSVAIDNNGVYRGQFPFNQWIPVNAQGRSAFARVGGGTVTATYWDPVTGRYSSASADLAVEGSSIEIPVKVLNLANVSGRVMKPAPLSAEPAPGTFVTLGSRTATTGDDGRFLFDGVVYGTYALSVRNDGLPGRAKLSVTLSAANAPLDLGAIVLDGTPPSVLQVTPVDGSTGLTRYPTFVVLFSEAIQVSNGSSIQAVAPDSVQYGYVTLSPDRRTMFWSPSSLSPGTAYVFRVRPDAFVDDSGWGLASPFLSSFTTRDDTGPAVVQTAPVPNAIQVPVATNVVAVFDSVLRSESIRGGTILLERTLPASGTVSGAVTPGGNSKTAIFTPAAPLAAESRYRATVSGLTDLSGNPMASAYAFSFWTRDDTSPAVSFDPPPVPSFFSGNTYTLGVNWSDPDVRSIDIRVNGVSYTTLYPPEGTRRATFNYYVGSDASTRIFAAKAADFSGNIGPSVTMTIPVVVDAKPAVSIQVTSPVLLLPGQVLSGRVTATDDRGLTLLRLYVSGPFSTYFEWKDVVGQLSATRDFSVTVPITAVSGGPVTLRADASDNNDQRQVSSATDSSASVLRDAAPPVITNVSPPTGASVLPGATVTVSGDVTDDFGLRNVWLDRPGNRLVSRSGSRFTFSFTAPTSGGDFSAALIAVDFAGNAATATVAFRLDADNPPTGSIAISPQGPVLPGASFTVSVAAQDDHGLANIAMRATGAASAGGSNTVSGVTATATFAVRIPVTAAAAALVTVYADITDAQGHTVTVGPATVTVAADTTSPALFNARPADGENVLSGAAVTIGVDASDNVAVTSVDITVDGVTTTTSGPFQIAWTAKTVSQPSPVSILFTALDRAGNSTTLGRSIVVNPLSNPNAPAVSIQCPTPGALFPPGQTVTIVAAASDDQSVQRVEFSRDSEPPFFTATAPPYQASYTIPPTLTDGATLTFKVKAYDYAGNSTTAQSLVRVVTGDLLTANTTILSGDATHDGRTLIVAAGTTAIDGPHSFARLVVLPGAAVTRVAVTTLVESPLDLTLPGGTVYVACGASITVSGKGYLGGRSGGNNRNEGMTFGNIPGSGVNNGGSHGGAGGVSDTGTAAPTFGSIADPRESGGGGGTGYYPGNNGGGVIVLKTGSLIVDGSIVSSGDGPGNVGGGGGSVNLDIQTLSGSGVVSAAGSYGYSGSGAGGRVALRYGDLSGFSRSRVVAGSGDGQARGSAGTVFLKSSTQAYGELIVDNGVNTVARTALPPTGQTLRFDKVTARNFAKVISQDEIDAVFDVDATSYVATPSRDAPASVTLTANPSTSVLPGTSLVVTVVMTDDNELEAISLQVSGVVPFAQTHVIRNTKTRTETFTIVIPADAAAGNLAITATVTDAFGHATATSDSVAVSPDTVPPVLSNARPASSATFSSGQAVTVGVDAADDVRVVSVDIIVDGVTATKTASPYQITYTAKSVAVATAVPVRFVARDLAGNVATLDWSITDLPVSNPNAPKVMIACPTAGAMFPPGYTFTVSVTATDDQAVDRVEFYADAATVPFATDSSSPYSASYAIPPGAADGTTVSIRARAWDFAGNFSDALSTITVVVGETISTDTTIGPSDLSRDGKTLIFTGGTTTVIGPHSFARLAVLSGSSLTQTQTTSAAFTGLDLTVTGRVYVACGASLDTYGKGYLGAHRVGNSSDSGLTFGNVPGSGRNAAGSHGGVGSGDSGGPYPNDVPAPTYGSPFDPREPGGGGGAAVNGLGTLPGSNGGGVVLVRANSLVLDGFLGAMGDWNYGEAAAGGSIRLDVVTLSGSGSITASTSTPYYGGGAGGRIAIYGDISGFDPARINASAGRWAGGAGTVYLRLPGETYGELAVDNGGLGGGGRTPFPAVGAGTVAAAVGATFTDSSKTFQYSVVGYTVEFRRVGALVGAYRVVSQSGGTLTLDAPIEGTVQAGDVYQGVIKVDKLTLRNAARLSAGDILDAASFVGQGPAFVQAPLVRGDQLAIRGAGFEVDVPFSFGDASLTGGAEVRTAESDSTALRVISLTVSGALTIDATSGITAQGSGYLGARRAGANAQDTGMTFGNLPGSPAGGSHGGLGASTSSPTFGSLFDPREAGGGAGAQGGSAAGNGGGVVLLKVGSLALDGAIGARGGDWYYYGNAGGAGSIRIEADSLSGAGTIRAQGGGSYYLAGGGGRVAVFTSDFASFDKAHITAPGGRYGTNGGAAAGAGTVYLKSASQPQGELVVDNEGGAGGNLTPIPSIGSGTVTAVSGSSLTDSGKNFPFSVVGLQVEVKRDASLIGTYRVVSQSGGSLVLDAPIEGTVRSGDAYQGILALDAVSVRNHSRVITRDEVRAPLNVDSTSYLLTPSRDAAPTVTVSTNPTGAVLAGTNLLVTLSGADDNDLAALDLQVTGPVAFSQSKTYTETKSRTETYTIAIPLNATPGSLVIVATARDTYGHATSATATVAVTSDVTPPVLSNPRPSNGATVTAGQTVTVGVDASDNVGVASVDITIAGVTTTRTGWPYQTGYTAPPVSSSTAVPVRFTARDNAGNTATLDHSFTVAPLPNPNAPVITLQCPTAGALFPAGYAVAISLTVSDDQAVAKVEFSTDPDPVPFATITSAPYAATYTVPPALADGTPVTLRIKAYDFANNVSEALVPITIVAGDVISSATTITSDDLSHEGRTVIVSGGTTTISGPHSFARLVILAGAKVTHDATTASTVRSLALTVPSGAVYIACGGSMDVSGRGYPTNVSYAGATVPGDATGGSHMGYGGVWTGPVGSTFGSVYRPQEAGGGAGSGSAGGGIVRLVAGTLTVDGAIRANSGSESNRGGAGGSVWVTAGAVSGGGVIEARGEDNVGYGSGSGGAIAVEYTTASGSVLSNLLARAGTQSYYGRYGGAGTVWIKGPLSTYGDLTVDNKGIAGQATELPSLGSGTAQAGSAVATLVTDRSVNIPAYFAGHWVEVSTPAGALKGSWRISTAAGGIVNKTVTLAPNGTETIDVQPGDKWQGVYRFDNLAVKGGAQLTGGDVVRVALASTGAISYTPASPVLPGKTISVAVAAVDNSGLAQIVLSVSGAVTASQTQAVSGTSATGNFSVVLPVTAAAGSTVSLIADVTDTDSNVTRLGPVVVTVAADTTPPVLSNPRPADGATFGSGASVTVGVDAADDVGVLSVNIMVDGVTTTKTTAPYQITYTAKAVTTATAVPIRFVAKDRAANTVTLDQSITVIPLLASVTVNPSSVLGGVSATGTVTLSSAAPSAITVALSSGDTTVATVPLSVTVPANAFSAPFTITTKGVAVATTVAINASYGTMTRTASLTVAATSLTSLTLSPASATGGGVTITGTVTLDGIAPPAGAVVTLTNGDLSAAVIPASVSLLSNTSSKTFTVTSNSVPAPSTFDVTASYNGVSRKATLTVLPPAALASVSLNPQSVPGGASATGTVTLTAPAASSLTVSLSSGNAAAATVPLNVILTSGSISGTFAITTHPVGNTTTFDVSATLNGVTRTAPLTVTAAVPISLTLTPASVVGSGSSATGKVTLDGAAPTGGTVITLLSSDTSVATVPASATVIGTTVTFPVTSKVVTTASTADISATCNGVTRTATLTVAPPSAPPAGELTEGGASSWGMFASDGKAATVANDSTRFAVGSQSLRFDTASGYDTGVKYPASGSLHWDLSGKTGLVFWAYAVNANSPTFQGNQPVVVLNSPAGTFRYTPQTEAGMFLDSWHLYQIPIGGSAAWLRTTTGTPTISDVTSLEIHQDTWGAGFTIWYDGVEFSAADLTSLAVSPATIAGGKAVQATVTLSAPAPSAGTLLLLSTDNANVAAVPASILVAAGANAATFPVTTSAVTATTPITLSAAYLGAARTATLTVVPTAAPALNTVSLSPSTVVGGTPVTGTATLTGPAPSTGATVTLSSANAAATVPSSVTIAAGASSAPFTVTTKATAATATFAISGTYSGATRSAALTVLGAAPASVALNPSSVVAGSPSTGTITLNGPAPAGGLTVALQSSNTASATVPASVSIAANVTSKTFTVTTLSVSAITPVTISATAGGVTQSAILTVTPAAALASVALNPATVTGGSPSAGTVTMTSAPAADATVNLASSNISAATVPASVKVLAGTTSATFAVTSKTVAAAAASNITATYAGATRTAALTVNPPALAGLAVNPASVAGVGTSTATVTLTGPAPTGGAAVSLSSTDATVATTPASVLVPAAASSATFSVTTRAVAAPATADISAAYAGVTKLATLTVTPPPALDSLTLTSATVTGGIPVTGTVTLTYPAVAGGTSVSLTSGNIAAATVPMSVTVPAGTLTRTFSVTTKAVAANATFNISATLSGVTKTGSLTVQAAMLASLTLTPGRVNGGISSVGAIALTGIAPAGSAVVTLSSTNPSSATSPSSVTVPAGTATAYFLTKTKPLAATAAVNISATYSGVTKTAPLTLVNPDAPVVTLTCPTSGALFPAWQTFAASAVASDAQSVSRVEFWIDGQTSPFATSFVAPYQASYTVPAGFADGATFTLRARAYDAGGNLGESAAGITVVAGDVLSADTTISAADATHDGKTLIVAAGTTTIEGPHVFARLAVLPGAVVRHVPATSGSEPSLDVTVTGALYVACGGAIDASGIGYLGGAAPGNSLAQGLTFGNVAGSEQGAGGSHGGLGGDFSASQLAAQTFGSIFLPRESGGGGGAASGAGGGGGGAVSITAGSAVVDGAILADGAREVHSGGAGGTVRLDAANLSGSGVIRAAGAESDSSTAASGGGGRIALRYTSSSFDPARVMAPGGNGGKEPGGAGTVLLKPDAKGYGELVVDNGGAAGADTPLPSIGTGTVTNVAGGTVTDSNRTFPYSVEGLSIEFQRGATVVGAYRVVSSSGGTMTLDRTAAGTVQAGDTYQGVLRLDMLTVKNGARLTTSDRVPVAAAAISLDPNDVVGGLPATGTVTLSAPAPAAGAAVTLSSANTAAATVPASVTVPAGGNAVTFSIATKPVAATVIFEISASFGGVARIAPLTVEQPALVSLALSSTSVVGGVPSIGTLTLSGAAPAAGVGVMLSSANAAATVPASVTIAAGASTGTFTAATKAVTSSTPVTISATNAGVTQAATLTVLPPAAASVTVSPADVVGGASPTGTVTLTGIAPTGDATVTLSSSNANAATVPASVTVAAGTTSKTFTVTTKTVTAPAPVTISASYGGATQTASLTVEPPSLLSVTVSPASVTGGAASKGTVTLTGAAPTGGATVAISSSSAAAAVPVSVTVAAGTSSKTFTVTTAVVASTTPAAISGIYAGATQSATLTVLPAAVSSVAISPASIIGGVSATGTVTLTGAAPAGGLPVTLGSDKTAAATVPASVTVPASALSVTFPITTYAVAAAATASISATCAGATASGALAIAPPAATSLTLNPATVKGGVSSTGTVTLTGVAPTGGAVVTLSSANAAATVPASVTVLAGSTSATFPITTKTVTATVSFNISAFCGGATRTIKLTVNP
jgi:protocatechuate 3,4-dioxygenase beta subunit